MKAPVRRLGLVGDVHAEHRRLAAALEFLSAQGVDAICCTGDIADGPGCIDTCCRLLAGVNAHVVAGNHDRWLLTDRLRDIADAQRLSEISEVSHHYLVSLQSTSILQTPLGDALLCHGILDNDLRKVWPGSPRMRIERSPELDELIAAGTTRFVINGHLHYRVLVNFQQLTLINAGTLKGTHRPGVSIIDFAAATVAAFEFDADLRLWRVAEQLLHGAVGRRIWRDTQEFDSDWTPVTLYAA